MVLPIILKLEEESMKKQGGRKISSCEGSGVERKMSVM